MNTTQQAPEKSAAAQSCGVPAAKAGALSSRTMLIGGALILGAATLFFSWNWLVAAGVASVIVAAVPCLVMCALGICASRMGKKESGDALAKQPSNESEPKALPQEAKPAP